jgi:UDP-N-acetylglucosamine--N-acetylmuramyl-(pentapeptide) pyrophosphoryl-undecaprenol N-acetylglucosamine transferase
VERVPTGANSSAPCVAIACGGTGGHLFPGLAVAQELVQRGCAVTLLVSQKDIDQQAVQGAAGVEIAALPAVGLKRGGEIAFLRGLGQSYKSVKTLFQCRTPNAALAMGGYTSAAPILAAKRFRAATFLHESNTIPGRANRLLSWVVDSAFVAFPSATRRLHNRRVSVAGTPVRPQFCPKNADRCRVELGLDPERPLVLVMGGSQGASGINELVLRSLPLLAKLAPGWQWCHLTGPNDLEIVRATYAKLGLSALVLPFLSRMEVAMAGACAAVSRAGASSLAELAAMRLPAVLIPYPAATDNHQYHNACAFAATGAARILEQHSATPEQLIAHLRQLVEDPDARQNMQHALEQWHTPRAAGQIADAMLACISFRET